MAEQVQAFKRVLDLVNDAGCMPHVMLVGSWAEFLYRESGFLPGFEANIRTMDVDFLVRNLRRPSPPARLAACAREQGFLVESDSLNGTTRIFDTSGLEVEFLINKVGAGLENTLKTNVGVTAQSLRHMDVLLGNACVIPCWGYSINVPLPEAYAIHKMVINSQRGKKSEKDARAVVGIWPYLNTERVAAVLSKLSKKERAAVDSFILAQGLAF